MMCRVIADGVPLVRHTSDKLGISLHEMDKNKERAADLLCFQNIEYLFDIPVLISGIKCQVDDLLRRVISVPRVNIIALVFFDKFHRRLAGRLPVVGISHTVPAVSLRCAALSRRTGRRHKGCAGQRCGKQKNYDLFHRVFLLRFTNIFSYRKARYTGKNKPLYSAFFIREREFPAFLP